MMMKFLCRTVVMVCLVTAVFCWPVFAGPVEKIHSFIGAGDSILIKECGSAGKVVVSKNTDQLRIPASILKVVTVLAAFDMLGPEYRFATDFYRTPDDDLVIKGYGDPCLVSQEIGRAAEAISRHLQQIRNIIVDDQWFSPDIRVPGRASDSLQPYDAPNGALCANYNTVRFVKKNGTYVSAEPQTPLLPFVEKRIRHLAVNHGRVMFVDGPGEGALYAGELFKYFLENSGCQVKGGVVHGRVNKNEDVLVYRHVSSNAIETVAEKLLRYSNNFIANQLFLVCGAVTYGPPATMDKGKRAIDKFVRRSLDIQGAEIYEGSGLSRKNRMSAQMMSRALDAFVPFRTLMREAGNGYYKTGTLNGISTRAGYIQADDGALYQYVVMVNTPKKRSDAIMPAVREIVQRGGH
ncbi:MAG: D-alanyl-D-alanine carboxypeptidase [Thermodesulfobacteriota bacterium]|nr:D-alanyl-D-alanine carboxypeptidase [Thermodesulfobacteriota bacterium]